MFVKAETFTSHVVNAIRMNMMDKFRQIYRSCDVLIIDDIHMLANKNATQEELFHTFNALHTQKKQIVLSANVKPRQIENMEDRLISRFEWGIPLKIQKLEKLEIKSLITMKNDFFHLNLTNSAIDFLFTTFNTNISGLQKALKALILRLHMNNTPHNEVKIEDIKHNLQDLLDIEKKEVITFDKIINTCASYFKLTSEDILGKSQTKQHTHPRQMAMYLCRQYLNLSYPKIGQLFKRDHSTVITSVKAIQKEMEEKSNNKTISSILEIRKTL
jgi:chromosomal replication initiator protein